MLLFTFNSYAQSGAESIVDNEIPFTSGVIELVKELPIEGTYQIIFQKNTEKREISDETLFLVNRKREFNNIVFMEIDKNTKIKIMPYIEINSKSFSPLPSFIIE
ncbi:MAG: hypothetical protein M3Q58_06380 [Bacteroidota bacterium]|nr:hypothetical protein [Bacteroidota bacterium]